MIRLEKRQQGSVIRELHQIAVILGGSAAVCVHDKKQRWKNTALSGTSFWDNKIRYVTINTWVFVFLLPGQWAYSTQVEYADDSLPSTFSGLTPFQCLYGYQPPTFAALVKDVGFPAEMARSGP